MAYGTNTTSAGRLSGNTTTEGVVVTASAPSTDDYAVAGWSGDMGTRWADVEAFFGGNPHMIGQNMTGNSVTQGNGQTMFWFGIAPTIADNIIAQPTGGAINGVFGTSPGLINGFSLTFMEDPEPSSAALFATGGATLLFFRRNKA